jgi:hypothetical protein
VCADVVQAKFAAWNLPSLRLSRASRGGYLERLSLGVIASATRADHRPLDAEPIDPDLLPNAARNWLNLIANLGIRDSRSDDSLLWGWAWNKDLLPT